MSVSLGRGSDPGRHRGLDWDPKWNAVTKSEYLASTGFLVGSCARCVLQKVIPFFTQRDEQQDDAQEARLSPGRSLQR